MTTPVSHAADERAPWNMLATGFGNWPFFVLTQEMGAYLVGSLDETFNYFAGETVVMQLPEEQRSLVYTLSTPQDLQIPQTVDERQGTLTVSTTDQPGNYQVQAGGSQRRVRRGFSANVPIVATRLDRIGKEELDTLFGPDRYRLARSEDEITRDVQIGRVGVELYPLLIVLVALALGLEHVLANRFYRRDTKVAMETPKPQSLEVPPLPAPPPVVAAASTNGSRFAGGARPPVPPPLPPEPKQPATVG
jgi:hypothetical protein